MKKLPLKKRVPFFAQIPPACLKEIARRAKSHNVSQWEVIDDAITRDTTAKFHRKSIASKKK